MNEPYHPLRTEAAKALVRAWLAMEPFTTEMLGDFLEKQGYVGMASEHLRRPNGCGSTGAHTREGCFVSRFILGDEHPMGSELVWTHEWWERQEEDSRLLQARDRR